MENVAKISFCHDLNDGWYLVKFPNGMKEEYNHYAQAMRFLNQENMDYEWEGDDYYNPEKDKSLDEPWKNRNYKTGNGKSAMECCGYSVEKCDFHNPENYYPKYPLAAKAILRTVLKKISQTELRVILEAYK